MSALPPSTMKRCLACGTPKSFEFRTHGIGGPFGRGPAGDFSINDLSEKPLVPSCRQVLDVLQDEGPRPLFGQPLLDGGKYVALVLASCRTGKPCHEVE